MWKLIYLQCSTVLLLKIRHKSSARKAIAWHQHSAWMITKVISSLRVRLSKAVLMLQSKTKRRWSPSASLPVGKLIAEIGAFFPSVLARRFPSLPAKINGVFVKRPFLICTVHFTVRHVPASFYEVGKHQGVILRRRFGCRTSSM